MNLYIPTKQDRYYIICEHYKCIIAELEALLESENEIGNAEAASHRSQISVIKKNIKLYDQH